MRKPVRLVVLVMPANKQVIFSIVCLTLIDMVARFAGMQQTAEHTFRYEAVFVYPAVAKVLRVLRYKHPYIPPRLAGSFSL